MRSYLWLWILLLFLGCNGGLAPIEEPETPSFQFNFPVETKGGNPQGVWDPASRNPLEVRLVDPDQIKGLVDSLRMQNTFFGRVIINADSSYRFAALLIVKPIPYLNGIPINVPAFSDTINATGKYEQPVDNVLIFSLHPHTFPLDTLGYTATADSLILVTQPAAFSYPGFNEIKYYMILRLRRKS